MAAPEIRARSSRRQLPITGSAHKATNGRRPLPAATGTARSARGWHAQSGSPIGPRNCCRFPISTSSSPCRRRSLRSPSTTSVYAILFRAAAETLITIAADPRHLGARVGITAVLHTWGRMSIALCPVAARRSVAHTGSPVGPASFCPSTYVGTPGLSGQSDPAPIRCAVFEISGPSALRLSLVEILQQLAQPIDDRFRNGVVDGRINRRPVAVDAHAAEFLRAHRIGSSGAPGR